MRTVITHFYNEEFLLPFWLRHHLPMFDHGILIDHHSTDRSAAIVREMAPDWTLARSVNADFDAVACDLEVMLHERTQPGWKIALTTTEFLCSPFLDEVEMLAAEQGAQALSFEAAIMVDPPGLSLPPLRPGLPLPVQRWHGYLERDHPTLLGCIPYHNRLYHRFPDGSYHPGRHISNRPAVRMPYLGLLLWYGFSPWVEPFLRRKQQIGARVPARDREIGRGRQHLLGMEALEEQRRTLAHSARDLRAEALFQQAVSGLRPASA